MNFQIVLQHVTSNSIVVAQANHEGSAKPPRGMIPQHVICIEMLIRTKNVSVTHSSRPFCLFVLLFP